MILLMILNEAAFLGLIVLDFQILFTVLGIKLSFHPRGIQFGFNFTK